GVGCTRGGLLEGSFDNLVGAGDERRRNGYADDGGGLEIDDQLEFGCQLHRQIGGLGALKNPIDVARRTLEQNADIRAVDHEATGIDIFAKRVDGRKLAVRQSSRDLPSLRK